jgi:hypothetical protein
MKIIVNIVKFVMAFTSGIYALIAFLAWVGHMNYVNFVLQSVFAGTLYFVWERFNSWLVSWAYPEKK